MKPKLKDTKERRTVYIATGLPHTGKSYWWKQSLSSGKLKLEECALVSPEEARFSLTGNRKDHSLDKKIGEMCFRSYLGFLSNKIPIIYFDDYNLTKSIRSPIIKRAKLSGYQVCSIFFQLDINKIIELDSQTETPIGEENLKNLYDKLEDPVYDEGFDGIIDVK